MLRDTDATLCGHCFSPAFNKEKDRHCIKEWYEQRPQYVQENLGTNLTLSKPNDYTFFGRGGGGCNPTMGYSRLLPLQSLKK